MKVLKHLTCVRHGETEGNAHNVRENGDARLSELGEQQSAFLGERFTTMRVDALLASPYRRAQQTAAYIAARTELPIETLPEAHERVLPKYLLNIRTNEPEAIAGMHTLVEAWHNDIHAHVDGSESLHQIIERARTVLQKIHDRPEEHITLVTHHYMIKVMHALAVYGKHPTSQQIHHIYEKYRVANTGLVHFTFHTEHGWQLVTWNDHIHLDNLKNA